MNAVIKATFVHLLKLWSPRQKLDVIFEVGKANPMVFNLFKETQINPRNLPLSSKANRINISHEWQQHRWVTSARDVIPSRDAWTCLVGYLRAIRTHLVGKVLISWQNKSLILRNFIQEILGEKANYIRECVILTTSQIARLLKLFFFYFVPLYLCSVGGLLWLLTSFPLLFYNLFRHFTPRKFMQKISNDSGWTIFRHFVPRETIGYKMSFSYYLMVDKITKEIRFHIFF